MSIDLSTITAARADLAAKAAEQRDLDLRLARLTALGAAQRAQGDSAASDTAAAIQQLAATKERLIRERSDIGDRIGSAADAILGRLGDPEQAVATLDGQTPIALLPMRIETRYAGPSTLQVRVYPDQIHLSAHDPALTDAEVEAATNYWAARWPDLQDTGRAADAWARMTAGFRPGRARYVLDTMHPTNAPPAEPQFPTVDRRASGWSVPPEARALPDRVAVVGYKRAGEGRYTQLFRVWATKGVPDRLAVGPTSDGLTPDAATGLPSDPGLTWLHDPAAAIDAGLFVTVTDADLTGGRLADGVDRLVVCGLDWTRTSADSAAELAGLLLAQHTEGDLRFVPAGTPTNNTSSATAGEDSAAGYDPASPAPALCDQSAGRVLAQALGMPPTTFDAVPHADLREARWQSALADALWRAGPGYYLGTMLDPVAGDAQTDADLRDFVTSYLRPGGPIPALRSGKQPYGILPVVARHRFQVGDSAAEAGVLKVATELRAIVEPLVEQVPRLGRAGAAHDVDAILLSLLQRTPVAWVTDFRGAVGPVQRKAISVYWDQIAAFQQSWTAMIWARLQTYQLTRLSELTLDKTSHQLDVPLVRKADDPGYLGEIRDLLTDPDGELALRLRENSEALLEALIAASAVEEYAAVGKLLLTPFVPREFRSLVTKATLRTPDTVRVEPKTDAPGPVAALASVQALANSIVPQVDPQKSIGAVVSAQFAGKLKDLTALLHAPTDPHYWMGRFSAALTDLADAPVDQLEWAFRGQLDAYSTRLDAWYTALASARLATHRQAQPTGVHLGAWGVVEDLHPRGGAPLSLGYVHTPSLAHATTAALLRSGRQAHQDANGEVFDVQLTSARTREALAVLSGVSEGQRLAALLGYRLERRLQDAGPLITRYIWHLRAAFPLRSTEAGAADQPAQSIAARDVVDGVALLDRWHTDRAGVLSTGNIEQADAATVSGVLDAVAGIYDAVSDVLVAEAVHQAAQGNLERAGAALGAHDRQTAAPELDVVRTPRPGHTLTQRAGILLQETSSAPGWPRDARGVAEPRVDRWLGLLLGDPSTYAVTARLVHPDGATRDLMPIPLRQLGLGPISAVHACARPGSGQPSELESLLALRFAAAVPDATAEDRIELLPDGPSDSPERGLGLLLTVLGAASEVVASPVLQGPDLRASGDPASSASSAGGTPAAGTGTAPTRAATPDAAELRGRVTEVLAALDDAVSRLSAANTAADATALEAALLTALPFESAALPQAPAGHPDGLAVLGAQAAAVLVSLGTRRAAAATGLAAVPDSTSTPGADPQSECDGLVGVSRQLLGEGQPVVPLLTPAEPDAVAASLNDRAALTGGDPLAPVAWLHQHAIVRPALDQLATTLLHAEADGRMTPDQLQVVQAPHAPGNRWCALPFTDPATPPAHGTTSLVAHSFDPINVAEPFGGLVVDSWSETVPEVAETTAIAYHVDAPGARPPQAVLLAVHPAVHPRTWDMETVLDTINEAVDLGRLRTLSTKELTPLGGFLPAWYLPDSYTRDVASVPLKQIRELAVKQGTVHLSTILGKG